MPGFPELTVLLRRSARARRLTLRVSASDHAITLTVPTRLPRRQIDRFLQDHAGWIRDRQAALPDLVDPAPGVRMPLEGREVTLVRAAAGRRVIETAETLEVPGDGAQFQSRLRGWVRETARARASAYCTEYTGRLGQDMQRLTLRDPRSRWGSCTSTGNIMLSWRLLLAPREVFAYVAAHEVAHLAEMNHSRAFWDVVERLYPDHAPLRHWLRENGATLHRFRL
ncbi:M48 family metallopeptidase [Oceanibium sediminis]|uniref:M48 family metallopeptidase n=1 Tax=Oceanibium sediminis TaxID=2026339 RepID=UPI001E4B8C0C|nr:SprT family zinc-dependent metalloprotease [Oceanibium sediminis]